MAFYSESKYLDLKKGLHSLMYEDQIEQSEQEKQDKGKYAKTKKQIKESDLASKTYLYTVDTKMILKDIHNICIYLKNKINGEEIDSKFPFTDIATRIQITMHNYQERPSLLDNIVEPVLNQITNVLRLYLNKYFQNYMDNKTYLAKEPLLDPLVEIIYIMIKVRGAKNVQKYLGHDTADFEPLLLYLIFGSNQQKWQTDYFLMIWLSVVLLIPFQFERLDSQLIQPLYKEVYTPEEFENIELLVIDFCKRNLTGHARIGKAIANCIAIIFRRPDMDNLNYFKQLLDWCLDQIMNYKETNDDMFYCVNVYQCIIAMIKNCKREYLVSIHQDIFEKIVKLDMKMSEVNETSSLKYYKLKMIISIIDKLLLPLQQRYIYRTLKQEIPDELVTEKKVKMITNTNEFEDFQKQKNDKEKEGIDSAQHNLEYIEMVEKIIDFIFEGLQDKYSELRFMAAKGMAKIGVKLPENLSDELLSTTLSLYKNADENLNHGICMVIGEFCRKGILTPKFLPQVVEVLKKSIVFEDVEGLSSSGSIVRDAACYICWSLARFYEKETMQPFVKDLADSLLLTALLDKTGNCRRAAAASFQENVGRQGNFPHGIAIISEMDYFTVSIWPKSLLHITPFVAHFKQYTRVFINHLADVKIFHFQKNSRIMNSKSLGAISILDPEFIANEKIDKLCDKSLQGTLFERHGSISALANILLAFSGHMNYVLEDFIDENIFLKSLKINDQKIMKQGEYMVEFQKQYQELQKKNVLDVFSEDQIKKIVEIPKRVIELGLLKGIGGEVSRIALSQLVQAVSISKIPLSDEIIQVYFEFIEEAFRTTIDETQDFANIALQQFTSVYFVEQPQKYKKYVVQFCKRIQSETIKDIKKSFCLGISSLPLEVIIHNKKQVLQILADNSRKNKKIPMNDPEIRKFCILSLGQILCKLIPTKHLIQSDFDLVIKTLLQGINDYTVDKRGDIGMYIREQAMTSSYDIVLCILDNTDKETQKKFLTDKILVNICGWILSQLLEPNDKLRLKAGFLMQSFVNNLFSRLPDFDGKQQIYDIFNSKFLRQKFNKFQDKYFQNYDVSLLQDKKYLSYDENEKFIYFWNVPKCSYYLVIPLISQKRYMGNMLKGIVFSLASKTEAVKNQTYFALRNYLKKKQDLQLQVQQELLKLLKKQKGKEKFYVSIMSCLNILIKVNILRAIDKKVLGEFIDIMKEVCHKTKSLQKLLISAQLLPILLISLEVGKNEIIEYIPFIQTFLFKEYPIVRNTFFENFYLYLLFQGEQIFGSEVNQELLDLLSNIDMTDKGNDFYYIFETRWTSLKKELNW